MTFSIRKTALVVSAAFAALSLAGQAQAGLLGSTVDVQYYAYGGAYDGTGSPTSFVADGGAHAQFFDYYDITVTDTKITYTYLSNTDWSPSDVSLNSGGLFITNGNLLTFSTPLTSVSLDPSSVVPGFSAANVTFNANSVAVDWQGVHFNRGDQVVFNVSAVPEPETYAMMLAGLGLMGAIARRRKQ